MIEIDVAGYLQSFIGQNPDCLVAVLHRDFLRDFKYFAIRLLALAFDTFEKMHERSRTAVHDRHLGAVEFNDGIVDSHSGKGGKQMFGCGDGNQLRYFHFKSYMGFDITSGNQDEKIYPGMIITYTVNPLLNIPMKWMTEITQVSPKSYFIDEQRSGPYKIWHHEHHFKKIEGGVEMTDILHYKVPLGFLGNIAEKLLVRKKVQEIFDFRKKKLDKLFPFG